MKLWKINSFSKFGIQTFSRFSTSTKSKQQNDTMKSNSTVDYQEISKFTKHCMNWWDHNGEMGPLHSFNPLRVQLVRDGLKNTGFISDSPSHPLQGIKLLDVGCGGGILSEPLTRIGANVTGIDASKELISIAQEHALLDSSLSSNLNYVHTSIEDFSVENKEKYDVVIASEILEHVIDQKLFIKSCTDVLKPKGSLFITTINKNIFSWLGGVVGAEYILKLLPVGTHDWNKFITPEDTMRLLSYCNCEIKLVHGLLYNPIMNKWSWIPFKLVNYAIHAVKNPSTEKEA